MVLLPFLNFQNLLPNVCKDATDYESWEPSDQPNHKCLNGINYQFIRRKQKSICHNPATFTPHPEVLRYCACTPKDYECDFCFNELNGACIVDKEDENCVNYNYTLPPVNCSKHWLQVEDIEKSQEICVIQRKILNNMNQ